MGREALQVSHSPMSGLIHPSEGSGKSTAPCDCGPCDGPGVGDGVLVGDRLEDERGVGVLPLPLDLDRQGPLLGEGLLLFPPLPPFFLCLPPLPGWGDL